MAKITIAIRRSQGVTMQYIVLSIAERAAITTRLTIAFYEDEMKQKTSRGAGLVQEILLPFVLVNNV